MIHLLGTGLSATAFFRCRFGIITFFGHALVALAFARYVCIFTVRTSCKSDQGESDQRTE